MSTSNVGEGHETFATLQPTPTSWALDRILPSTDEKKTGEPEVGDLVPSRLLGPGGKACTAESQGDISPRSRGRSSLAGRLSPTAPIL